MLQTTARHSLDPPPPPPRPAKTPCKGLQAGGRGYGAAPARLQPPAMSVCVPSHPCARGAAATHTLPHDDSQRGAGTFPGHARTGTHAAPVRPLVPPLPSCYTPTPPHPAPPRPGPGPHLEPNLAAVRLLQARHHLAQRARRPPLRQETRLVPVAQEEPETGGGGGGAPVEGGGGEGGDGRGEGATSAPQNNLTAGGGAHVGSAGQGTCNGPYGPPHSMTCHGPMVAEISPVP